MRATGDNTGGARQRRKSPAQRQAVGSDEGLRELLARELIGVCMATLKSHGLQGKRLAQLAASAAAEDSGQIASTTAVLAESQRLAELTNKWVEDPAYRDVTGRPAVLAIQERKGCSFAALAREFFPEQTVSDVVAVGCDARVIERIGRDKVALLNSTVLFTGSSLPILAYSIRSVRRLLGTADFNRRANSAALENWPDRTSYVNVSNEDFREFVRVFRLQISELIESSNRWLFQRSGLSRNRHKQKRIAGLQVFIFRE
jgi:hypothetical protein